jgi:hypothetical protein
MNLFRRKRWWLDDRLMQAVSAIGRGQLALAAALMNASHGFIDFFRLELIDDHPPHCVARLKFRRGSCAIGLNPQLRDPSHQNSGLYRLMASLWLIAACRGAPDGAVWLNLGDAGHFPGLAFCDARPEYALVPDSDYLGSGGYHLLAQHYLANDVPWSERRPQAFWRGGTSGYHPPEGWRGIERIALCELAAAHPDRLDAGITAIAQIDDPDEVSAIQASGLMRPFVPHTEFHRYRYQIDIDGNTNAWAGLFKRLLTGSTVLKVASRGGYRQWYYDRLVPWENYVPVATDMSDLVDRQRWLVANDAAAQRIGAAGRALALSMVRERELKLARQTVFAALAASARGEVFRASPSTKDQVSGA